MTETSRPYASTLTSWMRGRDSYGRSTQTFYAVHRGQWGIVAVVTTLPQAWVDSHGSDRYMVSDWRREAQAGRPQPEHFTTLARAKAFAESLLRPLTEAEIDGLDAYAAAIADERDANKLLTYATHHNTARQVITGPGADLHALMHRIVTRELDRRSMTV